MPETLPVGERIPIGETTVAVMSHPNRPDWIPLYIGDGRWQSVLYLRRAELRALRDRLDEVDRELPEPELRA